ncbi:MAG: hypothetical protein M3137_05970 [Actinomycetota bacterium]|nr:hypothetical protein [Actinomycetota bacterium]
MCPCGGARRLLEARLAHLDEEMALLGRLRNDIRTMLDEAPIDGPATQSYCGPNCGTGRLQIGRRGPTAAAEAAPSARGTRDDRPTRRSRNHDHD